MRVGLLVVATGHYRRFVAPLWDSALRYFLPHAERRLFVFSERRFDLPDAHWVQQAHREWPGTTLYRYHSYLGARKQLADCDYLFSCDADMIFVDHVDESVLGDLVATTHPGFTASVRSELPYETRAASRAYVPPECGGRYFAGAFVGGRRASFLSLAASVSRLVDADASAGLVATWHDESYLNRCLIDTPPTKVLSPAYCAPQSWRLTFAPKLLALDKDHAGERQAPVTRKDRPPEKLATSAAQHRVRSASSVSIAAVTVSKRPYLLLRVLASLITQRRRPDAWLVFVHADGTGLDAFYNLEERARTAGIATIFARRPRHLSRGRLRNEAVLRAETFAIAAFVEDDDWYGPEYFALLAEAVATHPEADLFGIKEHDTAFTHGAPDADASNFLDRRRADGGRVLAGDRVTWCCPATLATRTTSWLRLGLRYEERTGDEEAPLWQAAEEGELILVRRPTTSFCQLRYIHPDGFGGPHGHTSGPVYYHAASNQVSTPPRSGDEEGLSTLANDGRSQSGISFAVRRATSASAEGTLPRLLVEDSSLAPGTVQIRGPGGQVIQVIRLSEDLPYRRPGLELVPVDGGYTVYDAERDRIHFLNRTASLVFELCSGESSVAQIAALLAEVFGPEQVTEQGVRDTVQRLAEEGLVVF